MIRAIEPARVAGELGADLLEGARFCADDERPIVGYAVVALYENGQTAVASQLKVPDNLLMNRFAFVGMVAELVRERLIVAETARETVNVANGYEED